jgi:hypothetical protein
MCWVPGVISTHSRSRQLPRRQELAELDLMVPQIAALIRGAMLDQSNATV